MVRFHGSNDDLPFVTYTSWITPQTAQGHEKNVGRMRSLL